MSDTKLTISIDEEILIKTIYEKIANIYIKNMVDNSSHTLRQSISRIVEHIEYKMENRVEELIEEMLDKKSLKKIIKKKLLENTNER